jgi:hypothetical protein
LRQKEWLSIQDKFQQIFTVAAAGKEKPRRLAKPSGGFEKVSGRREKPEVLER